MAIQMLEALYLMRELNVREVSVDALIETFTQEPEKEQTTPPTKTPEELPELPELPEPPKPPEEGVYSTYPLAKKACKKGEEPIYDKEKGGFINAKA